VYKIVFYGLLLLVIATVGIHNTFLHMKKSFKKISTLKLRKLGEQLGEMPPGPGGCP
jgi:hypothetical protein